MLVKRARPDPSKYEIVGILIEKGLPVHEVAQVCGYSINWTRVILERLGYSYVAAWKRTRPWRYAR